MASGLDRSFMI